ncbi:hypothetical protein Kpol_1050p62 [Vanderwaltozyma polyspora DSM 70294]|uniref:Uncharacterized protein n=1 Tax=Vanderwaltozyma polyspora (strain ATCC 22028 / DSM 70294 / BCRC 21397 / CBS 2163 / NBRC 10782 / NRRL Y-8283 / UCD 57-17) TaxID=436907 RepID=A7TEV8_VANPO|nr:uncharacterized protein Kpol_1050p62 [Vanderwaltozyma polyspora DSM 70294]EDO19204.1 hypothetical protein Kpol_1050p62 [Vanderwaltozyma polyspora DSM 70294]
MDSDKVFQLQSACMDNDLKKVQEFLEQSPQDVTKVDLDGRTGLHWAVSFQYEPIVRLLLDNMKGIDIDQLSDNSGWTPFHIACSVGNLNIVKMLYERDVAPDLGLPTAQGVTALHLAVSKKHNDVVKFLLDNGASVRVKDKKLQLPLHRAVSVGSMALVELLCDKNSPVNAKDFQGWTPLHHALAEGHADIAVLLVNKYNADYQIEDPSGLKPVDVAANENVKTYFLANI